VFLNPGLCQPVLRMCLVYREFVDAHITLTGECSTVIWALIGNGMNGDESDMLSVQVKCLKLICVINQAVFACALTWAKGEMSELKSVNKLLKMILKTQG
jgi:hypothetical protein